MLGTTQAPSHFDVASSTTAHIGKPMEYSLSCPSPDQRSWMPMGTFGNRRIFLEPGSQFSNPSGSIVCMTSEIKSRVRCIPLLNAILDLIFARPWFRLGSASNAATTSCTISTYDRDTDLLLSRFSSLRRRFTECSLR